MSERTKGRLAIWERGKAVILDDGGRIIGEVRSERYTVSEDIATARHITAVWNACEDLGLSTEQLESGVLREMVKNYREALEQIANLTIADSRSTPVWVVIATEALRNGGGS